MGGGFCAVGATGQGVEVEGAALKGGFEGWDYDAV